MKEILSKAWKDILRGENLDLYLTIFFAAILSSLSLLGINLGDRMAGATLAILALLAVTNLVNRHKFDETLREQYGSGLFKKHFPKTLDDDYEKANEIWLVGLNLSRTFEIHSTLLDDHLGQGRKLKVLLINPNSSAIEYISKTTYYQMSAEKWKQQILLIIEKLKQISVGHGSGVELRLIDFPLSIGVRGTNINSQNGKLYIRHYEYRTKSEGVRFLLTPKDEYWYDLYKKQLLALWEDAQPYEL
jgi:hypothetical protein